MSENGTSGKKVTFRGDAKEDVDKICIEVQTTSDNAGGQPTWGFSLQHKTFSALNYAQDFGTTEKESLKRTTSTKWVTLTKSRIVPCQILSCLCQHSQLCLDLPLVQTVIEFTDWIPKIMVQFFFYLRLYFGTDNVSRRLWQWIETNRLDIQSTRYQSIQDQDIQQPDSYKTESVQIMKVPKKVTLK